jgi:hypothetical protein
MAPPAPRECNQPARIALYRTPCIAAHYIASRTSQRTARMQPTRVQRIVSHPVQRSALHRNQPARIALYRTPCIAAHYAAAPRAPGPTKAAPYCGVRWEPQYISGNPCPKMWGSVDFYLPCPVTGTVSHLSRRRRVSCLAPRPITTQPRRAPVSSILFTISTKHSRRFCTPSGSIEATSTSI